MSKIRRKSRRFFNGFYMENSENIGQRIKLKHNSTGSIFRAEKIILTKGQKEISNILKSLI